MKNPLRVAVVGRLNAKLELLLADLSPAIHPRQFDNWECLTSDFLPELALCVPGTTPSAYPSTFPIVLWDPSPVATASELEDLLLEWVLRPTPPSPQARILGHSPAIARVRGLLTTTARSPHPLLLTGENGTGKDLAALVAHELSSRAGHPFIAVNCGAVPASLAETEFFGCVRGAFTGAENRLGFCHQALGGTLFLDEIGEMPLEIQAKLLRVLESKELRRVGASRLEESDFRLICATNRDLATEVKAGRFREDLYYRINVLSLKMPPLRERKEDLALLANHFLRHEVHGHNRNVRLATRAIAKMMDYDWPGNLRQLRNVMVRASVLHEGEELGPEHLEWEG